jgi:hypothetical protein
MEFPIRDARVAAQNVRMLLDCKDLEKQDVEKQKAIKALKTHLNGCIQNPTLGLMAEKRDIYEIRKENPRAFNKNYRSGLNSPEILELRAKFDKQFKEILYPKTWKARLKIIRNERITFYGTKPVFSFKKLLRGMFK